MSDLRETRLEKAKALKELGQGPYAVRFEPTHRTASLQLDHKDFDKIFDFPTSENIATWIFEKLQKHIPVSSVKFFEGTNKYCEVTK